MRISELKILHMKNPCGIDILPEFSWILESETEDTVQTAFCITVKNGKIAVWNTGKTESSRNGYIRVTP